MLKLYVYIYIYITYELKHHEIFTFVYFRTIGKIECVFIYGHIFIYKDVKI